MLKLLLTLYLYIIFQEVQMKKISRGVAKTEKRNKKTNQIIITKLSTNRSVRVDFDEHGSSN